MKVILTKDISHIGQKNDIKNVADGFARNFLLPHKLARPATEDTLKVLTAQREKIEKERAATGAKYAALVDKLKSVVLQFKMKVAEGGTTFGSVSINDIQDALKKQGIRAEKGWIILGEPIKTTGEHTVKVKFPSDAMGEFKILVEAE